MDLNTAILLGVIGLMGVNQLVMRFGALYAHAALFWSMQAINLGAGIALIVFGLPGLERFPVVAWLIALLFFFRTVQNNNLRATWLRETQKAERDRRTREVKQALAAAREDDLDETPDGSGSGDR